MILPINFFVFLESKPEKKMRFFSELEEPKFVFRRRQVELRGKGVKTSHTPEELPGLVKKQEFLKTKGLSFWSGLKVKPPRKNGKARRISTVEQLELTVWVL